MDPLFTRAAWDALDRAADQAVERKQRAIEPRHVLLGVLEVGAAGGLLLRDLRANRTGLVGAIDDSLPRRQGAPASARPSDLPYTGRAEEILEKARGLAREDGRKRVGTADLLLGLSAEKGITRTILRQFRVEEEAVRSARADRAGAIASEDRDEEIDGEDRRPAPTPGTGGAEVATSAEPAEPAETDGATRGDSASPIESGAPERSEADSGRAERSSSPALEDALHRRFSAPPAAAPEADEEEAAAGEEAARAPSAGARLSSSGVGLGFLALDGSAERPLYRQIADAVREAAATGRIEAGARLPAIRHAAETLSVSAGTVARAYRDLEESGTVDTRGTRGTFVSAPASAAPSGERIRTLAERLRSPVVAAYHMGVGPDELHRALDEAMRGILTPEE